MRLLVNERRNEGMPEGYDGHAETSVQSGGSGRWDQPRAWEVVKKDLRRLKWLDERVYELALERYAHAHTHTLSRLEFDVNWYDIAEGVKVTSPVK